MSTPDPSSDPASNDDEKPTTVIASPTKNFFVSMLTRDITLEDAILDLVDNALDAALRSGRRREDGGFESAKIDVVLTEDSFEIVDNCGGIDRATAHESAFRIGRVADDTRDGSVETIGMYGVGMKRAMFKMGYNASVQTATGDESFSVTFTREWMESPLWSEVAIVDQEPRVPVTPGTRILVTDLRPGIGALIGADDFVEDVRRVVGEHFAIFLERGAEITINGKPAVPARIEVLVPTGNECTPYYAEEVVGTTTVTVIVGVNSRILRTEQDEDVDPAEHTNWTMPEAGWNIFCNERAVLVSDKSRLTGWGILFANFHPQFAVLTGMVHFKAKSVRDLPISTTKRALNTATDAWLAAAKLMSEGMRGFITYTNAWKNVGRAAQREFFSDATKADVNCAAQLLRPRAATSAARPHTLVYDPKKNKHLPKPAGKNAGLTRVAFSRRKEDIEFLGSRLLEHLDKWKPAQVGEICFDRLLEEEEEKMNGEG